MRLRRAYGRDGGGLPSGDARFEFRVLGPLEVTSGGRAVALGGPRQRALLAFLLLHGNELVSRQRLVDCLWGERAPETAANALQVAVHGLRRLLGAGRVETRGTGYQLRVEPGELDLERFRGLVLQARSANPTAAAKTLVDALALWRGAPLADTADAPFARTEIGRLEEERLAALEARIDADLELGRHAELVGELETLVAEHPFREALRCRQLLALYRSGRQADALEAYARARRMLVEELGVDPGPALQELERAILRQDASLAAAPPPAVPKTNLPALATPLVGRELELAATSALLRREDVRLLTLTGAGGTGKTRLALAVASEVLADFEDGVWLVTLAPLHDPELVPSTVAGALGVEESAGSSLLDGLKAHLGDKRALLLLDNFEHLAAAAPLVSELLAAAPRLKALVTSRSVLRLTGEHGYPVPPLSLPDSSKWDDAAALLRNEAVALFVARAQAARPDFRLNGNSRAVAEICVALDGLPLALELAAARVSLLSAEALRARLGQRLPLLVHGPRDVPARQQTLRAAIDWSYDLLDEDERELFARLAVFAGGCSVEGAEEVCEARLEALASLVDKSLVLQRGAAEVGGRFGMLGTVREYALERLEERGEADPLRRRHAEHFVALAEQAEPELKSGEAAAWLERLQGELDNIRASLAWAGAAGEAELELRLASALEYFLRLRGHLSEGRRWLEGALARGGEAPPAVRAKALNAAANVVDRLGEYALSRSFTEQALAIRRELGDEREVARMLSNLGSLAIHDDDRERAAALFEETIPLFRKFGDGRALMVTLSNLAVIADLGGDYARGRALGEEALAVARQEGDQDQISVSLHNLARAALRQRTFDEAGRRFAESLELAVELGYREVIAYCLEGLGELAAARREWEPAARLLGAGLALFDELGVPLGPEERDGCEATIERLREALGEAGLAERRAEGGAAPLEQAVAAALELARAAG